MSGPKRLSLLGATGSIGTQTLAEVRELGRHGFPIEVVGLAAGHNVRRLAAIAREFSPRLVSVADREAAQAIKPLLPSGVGLVWGREGLEEVASLPEADLVLNAVVGAQGIYATLAALAAGKTLALANKESLVVGGELVLAACRRPDQLIPVDSEHAALYQLFSQLDRRGLKKAWITASGGAFRDLDPDQLEQVTPEQALKHPTWRMGPRITIDSATLVNKAFEVIEAHHLFDLPWDKIGVVLHPQSIVHALVELTDGSYLAQLATPDMRIPIRAALTHPQRLGPSPAPLGLPGLALEFRELPPERYPAFQTVLEAGQAGGTAPAVANAADEVLVAAFLAGKIKFTEIGLGLDWVLGSHQREEIKSLSDIEAADSWARKQANRFVERRRKAV